MSYQRGSSSASIVVVAAIVLVVGLLALLFKNIDEAGQYQTPEHNQLPISSNAATINIPFHNGNKVLQATANCLQAGETFADLKRNYTQNDCGSGITLKVYDRSTEETIALGVIKNKSLTGNSGALFVPYAITKDDKNIIVDALMGSPGTGGSMVDYGYAVIPVQAVKDPNQIINIFRLVAARNAHFYDAYSKVVYEKEYSCDLSAWPYQATHPVSKKVAVATDAILYQDILGTADPRVLVSKKDTNYKLGLVDESKSLIHYQAITPGELEFCQHAETEFTTAPDRTIALPK